MANFDNSASFAMDLTFKFFKDRMAELGISEPQLAAAIGVNKSTLLRNFKKQTEMPFSTYLKICGALELQPHLVAKEEGEEMPNRVYFN